MADEKVTIEINSDIEPKTELYLAAFAADAAQIELEAAERTVSQLSAGHARAANKARISEAIVRRADKAKKEFADLDAEVTVQRMLLRDLGRKARQAASDAGKAEEAHRIHAENEETLRTLTEALEAAGRRAVSATRSATEARERFAGVLSSALASPRASRDRENT
jgi:hypothetical protein